MRHPWFNVREALVFVFILALYTPAAYVAYYLGAPIEAIVVGTLVALFLQYLIGRRRAVKSVDPEPLPEELGWLEEESKRLADEFDIAEPNLYLGDMGSPNAFAVGRAGNGTVVISSMLVKLLDDDELVAVLAHECSHLRSRDTIPMVIGEGIGSILSLFVTAALAPLPDEGMNSRREDPLAHAGGRAIHTLVMSTLFIISRRREYIADEDTKEALDTGVPLATGLDKIALANARHNFRNPPEEAEALCIASNLSLPAMGSTHPPLKDRVHELVEDEPHVELAEPNSS